MPAARDRRRRRSTPGRPETLGRAAGRGPGGRSTPGRPETLGRGAERAPASGALEETWPSSRCWLRAWFPPSSSLPVEEALLDSQAPKLEERQALGRGGAGPPPRRHGLVGPRRRLGGGRPSAE